jgi:hypothetical protein
MLQISFLPGDIVKNTSNKASQIGVLIKRCSTHDEYWSVMTPIDIVTWFEPNMKKVSSEYVRKSRTRSS